MKYVKKCHLQEGGYAQPLHCSPQKHLLHHAAAHLADHYYPFAICREDSTNPNDIDYFCIINAM